mgnify:CR=1 FL=1
MDGNSCQMSQNDKQKNLLMPKKENQTNPTQTDKPHITKCYKLYAQSTQSNNLT